MKRIIISMLYLFALGLLFGAAIPGSVSKDRPLYASDRIKLKLSEQAIRSCSLPSQAYAETPSFQNSELDRLLSLSGGEAVIRAHIPAKDKDWEGDTGFDRWFIVRLKAPGDVEEVLSLFAQSPLVDLVCPEYFAYLQAIPNDNFYPNNWGHNNTAQLPVYQGGSHSGPGVGTVGFDSDAQLAWDHQQGYGDPNIIIAILDTGADLNHPDLRLVPGYDFGDNDSNPTDNSSEQGHGTSCSGIAAGKANNSLGIAGVAGGCSVMPLKIVTTNGSIPFSAIENALIYAGDHDVAVGSMSFGANVNVGSSPSTDDALSYAYNHGVTLFASTANNNVSTVYYPAKHPSVIAVGAASPSGQRKSPSSSDGESWWGSNYGVNTQDSPNSVDVMAPTILPATDISGTQGYSNGDYYMWFNGTSCAAPYAAGVAALMKSKNPLLTPAEVCSLITSTATDMTVDGGVGWDRYTGYGLVNADAALQQVIPGMPICSITYPPHNSVFELGGSIEVSVAANDPARSINSVQFFLDSSINPEYTDYEAPYLWNWETLNSGLGQHTIRAMVTDDESHTAISQVTVHLVLPADEGFESGNFSSYDWFTSGTDAWAVQNEQVFSGEYTAKAGPIAMNQSCMLSLRLNITSPGNLSFYRKVSSAQGHGIFKFTLDQVEQEQWSGEHNWDIASYPVSVGAHTFSWSYSKDASDAMGSDCAWLDQISFPAHSTYYWEPQNLQAAGGDSFVLLRWSAPITGNPLQYKVFRDGSLLSITSDLVYQDLEVSNGISYSYTLVAVYPEGESSPSAPVVVSPTEVTATEGIIGTGVEATPLTEPSPVNLSYRSLHGQAIYQAIELNQQGIFGPINIRALGFYIESSPALPLPSFVIRVAHTTAENVETWTGGENLTTVYSATSYQPPSGDYHLLQLSEPFFWNGIDNILVDTAFGQVSAASHSGSVRFTQIPNGYRYTRSNNINQSNVFVGGLSTSFRPNLKLSVEVIPTQPEIEVTTGEYSFGNLLPGYSEMSFLTVQNTGAGILEGVISVPNGFSIIPSGQDGMAMRNELSFALTADSIAVYSVVFNPETPGSYSGNLLITHNADSPSLSLPLSGSCTAAKIAPFVEGFESGYNDWTPIDAEQTNRWAAGLATSQSGNQSLYISQDAGLSHSYDLSSRSLSHLMRYISFPVSDSSQVLRFAWKANGEGNGPYYDFMRVYLIPAGSSPTPGQLLLGGQLGGTYNLQETWQEAKLPIPREYYGQTMGLVISWKNDAQLGYQPPAAIDNLRILPDSRTDYVLVFGDSLNCALPEVSDPNNNLIRPRIRISGIGNCQDYVTVKTGYSSLDSPFQDAALDISLSGAQFGGTQIVMEHNLGYVPPFLSYKLGSEGTWMLLLAAQDWTDSSVCFQVPNGGNEITELYFSLGAPQPIEPPWVPPFVALLNDQNQVEITWTDWSWGGIPVPGISSFTLWRSTENDHNGASVLCDPIPYSQTSSEYSYTDSSTVELTTYYYWMQVTYEDEQNSLWGPISVSTVADPVVPVPQATHLIGNFPNPFNPHTEIRYGLAEPGQVKFEILNLKGQRIRSFSFSHTEAGFFKFDFEGRDANDKQLSSGVYIIRMTQGNKHWHRKMTLLK